MKADSSTIKVAIFLLPLYLGVSVLRAEVTFQLGHVTARPGENDLSVPVSILVEPGSLPVTGWNVVVRYDPAAMGSVRLESTREVEYFQAFDQAQFYDPGLVAASVVCSFDNADPSRSISASNQGIVAALRFCLLREAEPGSHALEFVPLGDGPDLPGTALIYAAGGRTNLPLTAGGSVTVAGEPVAGLACPPDEHPPHVRPPDPSQYRATYKLEGSSALRGAEVVVPFVINAYPRVLGFTLSVNFDEEVLQAQEIESVWKKPDGSDYDFVVFEFNNSNDTPGDGGVDEGFLVAEVVFDLRERVGPQPDADATVLALHFVVKPDAPTGETEIGFVDGAQISPRSPPVVNIATIEGSSTEPEIDISPVFVIARMNILPDGALFIRGDSNSDLKVDISDAQSTLNYLFLGDVGSPRCPDAADANDDGILNIADPIMTLQHLFLGGGPLPPPTNGPGEDFTADYLGTCAGSGS